MGAPKPCLGYPNRTWAVSALSAQGLGSEEIAARINADTPEDPVSKGAVARFRHKANNRRPSAVVAMPLTARSYTRLKGEAAARGITPPRLAARLIEAVLADNMVDAILDDGGDA